MNLSKMLSNSEICSDILLSKVSTCDGDCDANPENKASLHRESDSEAKPKARPRAFTFLSKKCNENESSELDFQMTPKTTQENPFFRNNESILSCEADDKVFCHGDEMTGFDLVTQSKINKDILQNLLSQRDQLASLRNAKMSERQIALKGVSSLSESKSEKTIMLAGKGRLGQDPGTPAPPPRAPTPTPDSPNFDFSRNLNLPGKGQTGTNEQGQENSTASGSHSRTRNALLQNFRTFAAHKGGGHLGVDPGDSIGDSIKNLKELGLGESNRRLGLLESVPGNPIKCALLNLSFKKKVFSKEGACSKLCQNSCRLKIETLKKFFEGLSESHQMSREDVLGVLNEIFQES